MLRPDRLKHKDGLKFKRAEVIIGENPYSGDGELSSFVEQEFTSSGIKLLSFRIIRSGPNTSSFVTVLKVGFTYHSIRMDSLNF
jgi:hypothetical protein